MTMQALDYIRAANQEGSVSGDTFRVTLVTNFTDSILQKIMKGVFRHRGIEIEVFAVPYQQYHLQLKDRMSLLYQSAPDMTFVFFDLNPYRRGAIQSDAEHLSDVLADIETYAGAVATPVVIMDLATPYHGVYGNLYKESPSYILALEANRLLRDLEERTSNLMVCGTDKALRRIGEMNARDLRGTYAFDIPFTNEFFVAVAREWCSFAIAILGRAKKCLVLDLDNTLWGGIVGEAGPRGIRIGPDYPGLAFQNFQHSLLDLFGRGIILAVNSKNNSEDVSEVFQKNPHMILKEEHFAATRVNWSDKAKNLIEIADELNIGLDSMVFLDDDPVNRELVRTVLPTVTVPELPKDPEEYVSFLYDLDLFNQFSLTEEDKEKGRMYAEERARRKIEYVAQSVDEYIAALGIELDVATNDPEATARIAQLSQKTNQFNLTSKRYTESEVERLMSEGLVSSALVRDKFGDYGRTIVAITRGKDQNTAILDTFLMSCRVMGRGVEYAFMRYLAIQLSLAGFKEVKATFIPTSKNMPAKDFLPSIGFAETGRSGDTIQYHISLSKLVATLGAIHQGVRINEL
jgi:FkbH-like protein